jgi:salicylate hydroxylase
VWKGATKDTVNDVYGKRYHPFGKNGKVSDLVHEAERVIASNVFEEISFPSMSSGRVALLGDAAHSMTSFFGQGACQAIEDAVELANALQEIFSSAPTPSYSAISDSLAVYSDIREKRARDLVSFSANYARLHTATLPSQGWAGGFVRWAVYDLCPSWGWMWYLKWLYGYQPTVRVLPQPKR